MNPKLRKYLVDNFGLPATASEDTAQVRLSTLIAEGRITADKVKELGGSSDAIASQVKETITSAVGDAVRKAFGGGNNPGALERLMPAQSHDTGTGTDTIRVRSASEKYYMHKTLAKHRKTGSVVEREGMPIYGLSELELAKIGVWFKSFLRSNANFLGNKQIPVPSMSEHEDELLKQMYAEDRWSGCTPAGEVLDGKMLSDLRTKVPLINDATSGGQYLIPNAFDDAIVTFPLLYGELLPLVDLRTTSRDVVETASVGNPSVVWGTADGTPLTCFDATSMVTTISSTVRQVAIAIEFGRDFASDSPVDIAATLVEVCGQVLAKELDDVIAAGSNGSSQPIGIANASGTTAVNSDNGSTGPWTLGDIESLLFGIAKPYRVPSLNGAFLCNDTTYARWRALAVGTGDARRLIGMDHESYSVLNRPVKINGDLSNRQAMFCAMKKYRLYRRAGADIRFTEEGKTLSLANTALLVVRGRYAGQLMDANACAICADGQS